MKPVHRLATKAEAGFECRTCGKGFNDPETGVAQAQRHAKRYQHEVVGFTLYDIQYLPSQNNLFRLPEGKP